MRFRNVFGIILAAAAIIFIVLLYCLPKPGRNSDRKDSDETDPDVLVSVETTPSPYTEPAEDSARRETESTAAPTATATAEHSEETEPPVQNADEQAEPNQTPEEGLAPEPETESGEPTAEDEDRSPSDNETAAAEPGLYEADGYTYYCHEDGTMAVSEVISIDGIDYVFDEQGRWLSPLRAAVEASATAQKTAQLVLVVDHNLTFWEKGADDSWRLMMDTYCGYGGNGLVAAEERIMGSRTTPIGAFPLTMSFGTGENPGTAMLYRQITEESYWSSEEDETFNTWVESASAVSGEHLIDYYQYKYAVNIGFNLEDIVYSRGCAIFLHCKSTSSWNTAGCVSLAEDDMLAVLLSLRDGAYIIIVPDLITLADY